MQASNRFLNQITHPVSLNWQVLKVPKFLCPTKEELTFSHLIQINNKMKAKAKLQKVQINRRHLQMKVLCKANLKNVSDHILMMTSLLNNRIKLSKVTKNKKINSIKDWNKHFYQTRMMMKMKKRKQSMIQAVKTYKH